MLDVKTTAYAFSRTVSETKQTKLKLPWHATKMHQVNKILKSQQILSPKMQSQPERNAVCE